MRDMYMVSNAQPANGIALLPELTPEQEVAAHFRLLQALQTSLDPADLLQHFFKHLQPLLAVSGLDFTAADGHTQVRLGRSSPHHCDYKLGMDDGALGQIIFSRSKRFSERDLGTLEQLLRYLVHPLRNALHYQAALRLTMLDPLTQVGNRTALDTAMRRELQLAERHKHPLSLLLIDVDHFKRINDNYGHVRGDQVLKDIASVIESATRSSDITFRYGGEEFVVILGNTDATGACTIGERIRERIANCFFDHNGEAIRPTVSIGIATHQHNQQEHVKEIFERADKALYQAKATGRNRVVFEE